MRTQYFIKKKKPQALSSVHLLFFMCCNIELRYLQLHSGLVSCLVTFSILTPVSLSPFSLEDGTGEEQTAVTIASVPQAATFGDHNIQYQFRTEGGQVSS